MAFRGSNIRPWHRLLFWLLIGALLILAADRLIVTPTASQDESTAPVVISEFVVANSGALLDEDGDPSDWIELWNRSRDPVDLADWTLTNDPTRPDRWRFESVVLPADGRLLIFASGKDRRQAERDEETSFLHTNFALSADGGFLALYPPTTRRYLDGTEFRYPALQPDQSFGLSAAEQPAFLTASTPGEPNGDAAMLAPPPPVEFSHSRGLYDAPFSLALHNADPEAAIYVTLDGTAPTPENGLLYTDPVDIGETTVVRAVAHKEGHGLAPVRAHSYLFPADIVRQPALPPGAPETWGTHQIDFGGYRAGEPVIADYAMDPDVVDDPAVAADLLDSFAALPILSLSGDGIWDLYANPQGRGRATEQPVSVEFFDPRGAEPGFALNAGVRMQGGAGRWEFMPKHSFRLAFRSDYGAPQLTYPVFPDSPLEQYDTLILRAGTDRGYAGHPPAPETVNDHREDVYARDQWVRQTQIDISDLGVHGRFVHLFLNGLYWGIYNLVERPDADYWASYFGGAPEDYGVVSHSGAVDGPLDRFNVMVQLAQQGGLADPAVYATMLEFVDPIQFSDYLILNWYAGNRDWPENNWYVGARYPAGPNLFLAWDAEMTWIDGAEIVLGGPGWEGAPFPNVIKLVFEALMENPDFRMLFADRLFALTDGDGPLADGVSQSRWQALTDPLETAIVAESARWGDTREESPITSDDWRVARDAVSDQMAGNATRLIEAARAAGYYPTVAAPTFDRTDPVFADAFALTMAGETGEIFYTVDGTDPRASGGVVAASAVRYDQPLTIDDATLVRARILADGVWSPLREKYFHRTDQASDVRITEIMYNPLGGEQFEYIEISNLGDLPADLSGAYLTGVDFHFPWYRTLLPGESVALVSDFRRFRDRYPEAEIAGIFSGKLSDRGEAIGLYDRQGGEIDAVRYEDGDGWPLSADGTGDSLELVDPAGASGNPIHWRASPELHGSPGHIADQIAD